MHTDVIDEIPKIWSLSDLIAEYSTVAYLQIPEEGGELQIFDKRRGVDNQDHLLFPDQNNTIAVSDSIVDGCDSIIYEPSVGDFLIFDPGYYHKVLDSNGTKHRICCLTGVGYYDNKLITYI